jgi:hypothetical protein
LRHSALDELLRYQLPEVSGIIGGTPMVDFGAVNTAMYPDLTEA